MCVSLSTSSLSLSLSSSSFTNQILQHGLGDHSDKYTGVARQLVESGYAVVAHDAHGQGRSDGFRGCADSIQHYVDNALLAVADAQRYLPARVAGLPNFLLGHSLGRAVCISSLLR
jgi:alpha-beta hydrolase superfamily lysophospholipase